MIVFTHYLHDNIIDVSIEKYHNDLKAFEFYGNYEHLRKNKHLYCVQNNTIVLNNNYENEIKQVQLFANLNKIRELRKPLLQAFDTLEMKRKFILDGYIKQGEFPFIDSINDERWEEIKAWRDELRELPDGDISIIKFPPTPLEIQKFL